MMRAGIVTLILVALCCSWGSANGIYIPEIAIPKMPTVPSQRALITYRDGQETLVVQSALATDSRKVGWILPLPAEPTAIRLGDSYMLGSLAATQRPKVIHDIHTDGLTSPGLVLVALVPVAIALLLPRRAKGRLGCGILGALWLFTLAYVLPQFTNAGQSLESGPSLQILGVHRLGDYESTVLRAGDASALSDWLSSQGLAPLSPEAAKVVQQYIGRGWCFAASRIAVTDSTAAVPRPLVVTFPTQVCVFPMMMTGLSGSRTLVQLYIAAEQEAYAESFGCIAADRYIRVPGELKGDLGGYCDTYVPTDKDLTIGNPDVGELLWNGCVVTTLQAELNPQQMGHDVAISLRALVPSRQKLFSEQGRSEIAQLVLWWGLDAMVVLAAIACRGARRPSRLGGIILVCVGAAILGAAAAVRLAIPVVELKSTYRAVPMLVRSANASIGSLVALKGLPLREGDMDQQVIPALYGLLAGGEHDPASALTNWMTRRPIRVSRNAGDVSLRKVDGHLFFCTYDENGGEMRWPIGPLKLDADGHVVTTQPASGR